MFLASEFAARAGVTVRALHHYDRLGLLKPSRRSRAGYRLYSDADFVRLEQIVVLKFLGLPLKRIRELLRRSHVELRRALVVQRLALDDKRRHLERAVKAIGEAEKLLAAGSAPDSALFRNIIEVIEMQDDMDWTAKYYPPETRAEVEERKKLWTPELQEQVTKQWAELGKDLESAASRKLDPSVGEALALVARYRGLLEGFTGGNSEIQKGLNTMWADRNNWPAAASSHKLPYNEEAQAWILKALNRG